MPQDRFSAPDIEVRDALLARRVTASGAGLLWGSLPDGAALFGHPEPVGRVHFTPSGNTAV